METPLDYFYYYGNYYINDCVVEDFKPLKLQIDSVIYEIPAEKYLTYEEGMCRFDVSLTDSNYWVLGLTFLESYFQVYDMKRNLIGLAP